MGVSHYIHMTHEIDPIAWHDGLECGRKIVKLIEARQAQSIAFVFGTTAQSLLHSLGIGTRLLLTRLARGSVGSMRFEAGATRDWWSSPNVLKKRARSCILASTGSSSKQIDHNLMSQSVLLADSRQLALGILRAFSPVLGSAAWQLPWLRSGEPVLALP